MIIHTPTASMSLASMFAYFVVHADRATADRFAHAVDSTMMLISDEPDIGKRVGEGDIAEIRWWRVKGFPNHLIFYRAVGPDIVLVNILHGRRNVLELLLQDIPDS